jgi:hypothetical protein
LSSISLSCVNASGTRNSDHQRRAFLRRKSVFAQEILDAAHGAGIRPDRLDHIAAAFVYRAVLRGAEAQFFEKLVRSRSSSPANGALNSEPAWKYGSA